MATANKGLEQPANNSSNWDTPLNANFGVIDSALGAATSISVSGVGTSPVTLTSAQYQCMSLKFSGTLSNNVTYSVPVNVGGMWVVQNNTTGSFTLTINSGGGGSSVAVTQGTVQTVYSDGSNIVAITTASGGGGGSAGSNTQVIYNSLGTLTGSANLTFNGTTLTAAGLSVSGQALLAAGSAALPSLAGSSDPNTGIYLPAADTLAIATNGTARFAVNSGGAVAFNGSYGTSGQFLQSAGSASPPAWVTVSSTAYTSVGSASLSSGSPTLTLTTSALTSYRFLRIVIKAIGHNSGSSQTIRFNGKDISQSVASSVTLSGMIEIDLVNQIMTYNTGNASAGAPYGAATTTTYSTSSTSFAFTASGGSNLSSGSSVFAYAIT